MYVYVYGRVGVSLGNGSDFGKDKKEDTGEGKTGEIISASNVSDMQEEIAPQASPLW